MNVRERDRDAIVRLIENFRLGDLVSGEDEEGREILRVLAAGIKKICIDTVVELSGEYPTSEDFVRCVRDMLSETLRDALLAYIRGVR